jgi:hypothetical protein
VSDHDASCEVAARRAVTPERGERDPHDEREPSREHRVGGRLVEAKRALGEHERAVRLTIVKQLPTVADEFVAESGHCGLPWGTTRHDRAPGPRPEERHPWGRRAFARRGPFFLLRFSSGFHCVPCAKRRWSVNER